jgi:enoyl-CoA hydratase/carnithine racemase
MSEGATVASTSDVTVELGADRVAVIEIHRPPNNFFDTPMIEAIAQGCEHLAAETDCRAVVLCSEGRHFCAGANFSAPGGGGTHLYVMARRLFSQPLPIVAAVQGAAVGGGLGLALAADFRVACPEARFTANFARLGFHHGFGLTVTLPRVVGEQKALELLYTGKRITGDEALSIGLCDRLVDAAELRDAARAFAIDIAGSAPLAVRSIRETMRGPVAKAVDAALDREMSEQDRLRTTADFREGVAATAERREPHFTGR